MAELILLAPSIHAAALAEVERTEVERLAEQVVQLTEERAGLRRLLNDTQDELVLHVQRASEEAVRAEVAAAALADTQDELATLRARHAEAVGFLKTWGRECLRMRKLLHQALHGAGQP